MQLSIPLDARPLHREMRLLQSDHFRQNRDPQNRFVRQILCRVFQMGQFRLRQRFPYERAELMNL